MTRKRYTEEQIIAVLKDAQAGVSVQDLCRKHGISDRPLSSSRTTMRNPRQHRSQLRPPWRKKRGKVNFKAALHYFSSAACPSAARVLKA